MKRVLTYLLTAGFFAATVGAAPASNAKSHDSVPRTTVAGKKSVHKAPKAPKAYQIGKASWYGTAFQGRETASGEPYNMYDLTAAHRSLPLGSWVRVTNLRNGDSVIVRINDRGPVPKSRIIDLSYQAATLLHLRAEGIAPVRLDVMNPQEIAMALNAELVN